MRITRKQTYSALAGVGILLGTAGLASAATGGTVAPTDLSAHPATAVAAGPDDAEGAEQNEVPEQDEADEQSRLAGLATITADDAGRAALSARPGTVTDVQLENENGNVVYRVLVDTGNGTVDVKVDAGNADVLTVEADDEGGERHSTDGSHGEMNEAPGTERATAAPGSRASRIQPLFSDALRA